MKGPEISDIEQKANIINSLNQAGAITPNMLIPIINSVLNKEIEPWNEELGNVPFELLKLKIQSATAQTSEEVNLEKSENEIDKINNLIDLVNNKFTEGDSLE